MNRWDELRNCKAFRSMPYGAQMLYVEYRAIADGKGDFYCATRIMAERMEAPKSEVLRWTAMQIARGFLIITKPGTGTQAPHMRLTEFTRDKRYLRWKPNDPKRPLRSEKPTAKSSALRSEKPNIVS
jgi:hypothetical protein